MIQVVVPSAGGLVTHRPVSTKNRVIIPVYITSCCSSGPGFELENRLLPIALKEAGIIESEWDKYMLKFEREILPYSPSACMLVNYWMCALVGLFCCLWQSTGKFQGKVKQWLDEFNNEVFERRNLYSKFQSNEIHADKYHETISWFAIALDAQESDLLKKEAVMWSPKCCSNDVVEPTSCQNVCCYCGPKRWI